MIEHKKPKQTLRTSLTTKSNQNEVLLLGSKMQYFSLLLYVMGAFQMVVDYQKQTQLNLDTYTIFLHYQHTLRHRLALESAMEKVFTVQRSYI